MLQRLATFGRQLGEDLASSWQLFGETLAEGWQELKALSTNALTRFTRKRSGNGARADVIPADAPRWSLLAGDVVDTGKDVVVRLEIPGVDKNDCELFVRDNTLFVRGEKRADMTYVGGDYHIRQCAFGSFERAVALPCEVQDEKAEARFANGVLTVRLPKARGEERKRLRVV